MAPSVSSSSSELSEHDRERDAFNNEIGRFLAKLLVLFPSSSTIIPASCDSADYITHVRIFQLVLLTLPRVRASTDILGKLRKREAQGTICAFMHFEMIVMSIILNMEVYS